MNRYPNAASGLKKIFLGQILGIVGAILAIIPLIGIVGAILLVISVVIDLIGVMEASKDAEGYQTAMYSTVANLVVSIIQVFLDSNGIFYKILDLAGSVLSLVILYYICNTTADLLRNIGAYQVADQGTRVWNINKTCLIITLVCSVLAIIPIINIIAALAMIVVAIVSIYAAIIYIIFIKHSYEAFESPMY